MLGSWSEQPRQRGWANQFGKDEECLALTANAPREAEKGRAEEENLGSTWTSFASDITAATSLCRAAETWFPPLKDSLLPPHVLAFFTFISLSLSLPPWSIARTRYAEERKKIINWSIKCRRITWEYSIRRIYPNRLDKKKKNLEECAVRLIKLEKLLKGFSSSSSFYQQQFPLICKICKDA